MLNLATVLCYTLLHSLWQAGLLYSIYKLAVRFSASPTPLSKRNVLYGLITMQWFLSILTFCLLSMNEYANLFTGLFSIPHTTLPLDKWLITIYGVIVSAKLLKLLLGLNLRYHHVITSEKIPAHLRLFTSLKQHELGVRRKVKIAFAKNITGPLTYGILKPIILFPVGYFNHISTKEAEMILLHELIHVRYHDYLLNIFMIVSEVIFFFNPFIKWMGNDIRLEREKNCDAWVLQFKYCRIDYAEALFKTAALSKKYKLALAAVSTKNELMKRIQSFTGNEIPSTKGNFKFFVYAGALVLLIMCASLIERTPIKDISSGNMTVKMIPNPFMLKHLELSQATPTKVPDNLEVATKPKMQETTKEVVNTITNTEVLQTIATAEVPEIMEEVEEDQEIPVAFINYHTLPFKQVTITETNAATGESVVQSFKFVFYQNEWVVIPNWQLETLELTDSLPSTPVEFSPIQ